MVARVHEIRRLECDTGYLLVVEPGELLGQPFQRRTGDDVLGFGDVRG